MSLAQPKSGWTSLKDFTNVVYNGKHIVYASNVANGTLRLDDFTPFTNWSDMARREPERDAVGHGRSDAVLLRAEEHLGAGLPVGSVAVHLPDLDRPDQRELWSSPQPLFTGSITGSGTGPIDQTLIGDGQNMYLFFAGDNGKIYRASMPIGNFPGSFGSSYTTIMSDTRPTCSRACRSTRSPVRTST